MAKKSSATLDDLLTQARFTNLLLVADLRERMKQQDIIGLLATSGASHREIAEVLNTTADVVSTTLRRLRKKNDGAAARGIETGT